MKTLFIILIAGLGFTAYAQPDTIFLGSSPNDGTGDPLRTAFGIVNTNDDAAFDTLEIHLDSLQAVRVNVNDNVDSLAVHLDTVQALRTDINASEAIYSTDDSVIKVLRYIDWDLTDGWAQQEGRTGWNADDVTLETGLSGGSVLQHGQEMHARGVNKYGLTLYNGTPVYISGVQGNRPSFDRANDASIATSLTTIGLTTQDIANNATGYVTTSGIVRDIPDSMFITNDNIVDGELLYLGAGRLTDIRPNAPATQVAFGFVINTTGSEVDVIIDPVLVPRLAWLSDVGARDNQSDGDILMWNSDSAEWKPVDTLAVHLDTMQAIRVDVNSNLDSIAVSTDTAQALRVDVNNNFDSLVIHLDTLQALRVDENNSFDSLAVHLDTLQALRVDVDDTAPLSDYAPLKTDSGLFTPDGYATMWDARYGIDTMTFVNGANFSNYQTDTFYITETVTKITGELVVTDTAIFNVATIATLDYIPPHAAINFSDSATVIALTQNVWAKMTGPVGNLFVIREADGITVAGDTMTIVTDGAYEGDFGLSFDGTANDVFHVAVYKNGVVTSWEAHRKTSNNDTGNLGIPFYLTGLNAGDDISIYIRNTGDNDDATLISGQFIMKLLHPD